VYGADGVLAGGRTGAVVIDFGTSLPASTLKIGADMVAVGATYLDAPLGRTPAYAVEGKLNIMGAGDKAAFDKVEPVLKDLGENVFHLGPLGTGHTIKLINNFFGMTTACAMSEAFAMADVAGIDRQSLYSVMSAGPLRSGMMDFVRNYAVDGKQDLEFSIANASKDVGYYGQMAKDLGLISRMSGGAAGALSAAVADGQGDEMVSSMGDVLAGKFAAKAYGVGGGTQAPHNHCSSHKLPMPNPIAQITPSRQPANSAAKAAIMRNGSSCPPAAAGHKIIGVTSAGNTATPT
jgi:2-hydroxy-3-oxopropionate reductase